MNRDHAELVTRRLVDLTELLVADYDIVELFDGLVNTIVELLPVSQAGLLLLDESRTPRLAATTSEAARHLELFQLTSHDGGPCLACIEDGARVSIDDLGAPEQRWPVFAQLAVVCGFASVDAIPLRLHGEVLGALNLFGEDSPGLSGGDVRVAQALADLGTIGIVQQLSASRASTLAGQLQQALESRVAIEQAKGILAEHAGIEMSEAFRALRAFARSHRRKLHDVAEAVSARQVHPRDVLGAL